MEEITNLMTTIPTKTVMMIRTSMVMVMVALITVMAVATMDGE
jgi:hypothetical protein